MTILQNFETKLQTRLPNIDPTTIAGIITAIMSLFKSCTTTPTPSAIKEICQQRPIEAMVAINLSLRDVGIRPMSPEGRQAHSAVLSVGAESTGDEIGSFISYAQGQ